MARIIRWNHFAGSQRLAAAREGGGQGVSLRTCCYAVLSHSHSHPIPIPVKLLFCGSFLILVCFFGRGMGGIWSTKKSVYGFSVSPFFGMTKTVSHLLYLLRGEIVRVGAQLSHVTTLSDS